MVLRVLLVPSLEIEDMEEIIDATTPKRYINVVDDNCIGCGECINECPVDCIELEIPSPIHINDTCVFCGKCVDICQFKAIKLGEEYFMVENNKIFFVRDLLRGSREGEIDYDVDACMACGVCVKKCPTNALKLEKDEIIVDQDKCVHCAECEIICPVNAIKLKTE